MQYEIGRRMMSSFLRCHPRGGRWCLGIEAAGGMRISGVCRAAFAVRAPEGGDVGLDAGESGSLLHRALQAFWRETKTQDGAAFDEYGAARGAVVRAVDAALPGTTASAGASGTAPTSGFKSCGCARCCGSGYLRS